MTDNNMMRGAFEAWLADNSTYNDGESDCWKLWQEAYQAGQQARTPRGEVEAMETCHSVRDMGSASDIDFSGVAQAVSDAMTHGYSIVRLQKDEKPSSRGSNEPST